MSTKNTDSHIALVNEQDEITGYLDKLKVHQDGILHRAFSVVVVNQEGQWLMHRRALDKYHSGGAWTNTCCSHLKLGESMVDAARNRLSSEMGISADPEFVESFHYRATFDNGLVENEIDHIFIAIWDGSPKPDPEEVMDWKWCLPEEIEKELASRGEVFTPWFPLVFNLLKPRLSYHS
jgi:isopentenyl-diphosphate delta-isomerase